MSELTVRREGKALYNIVLSDSFMDLAAAAVSADLEDRKFCIVTDSNVAQHYLDEVRNIFDSIGDVYDFTFEAGEKSKNLETVKDLYYFLIENHFERGDVLAALGGGVTGDITGFAAATYLRGIRFIQIPTSLLAQVDSSIGGKTGVDLKDYKNMVGAFHQPALVYANTDSLLTLPDEQFVSGMGEVVKHGLIRDKAYYAWLKENHNAIVSRNSEKILRMVEKSCFIKKDVVEKDPNEKGERAVLNFGHTIGHAVEKLMEFNLLHGECVAIGINAAAYISFKRGYISAEELADIRETLLSFGLPIKVKGITPKEILEATKSDKKMDHGNIRFVLLDSLGSAGVHTDVNDEEILAACWEVCSI
ncbi:MAG: 3-dehydroquinate synthase [Lachnospiraceae bacterium]|nr:3-dehydroquinate synthase [Lachnospiraceae bacterium]